jgi:MFS family permease
MLPLTAGFLIAGPVSGFLSDHYGARPFATGGMVIAAVSFGLLELLPADFGYPAFALLLLMNGMAMGLFASPNRAGIMNSLPATQRGAGSGMTATFQNSAMVLSIGIFFTLIISGLAGSLPTALYHGLTAQGISAAAATKIAHLPPTGALFAAFLGYNPVKTLLGPALVHMAPAKVSYLTGRTFFSSLISKPFMGGLHEAFDFAVVACLIAAVASWLRGGKYHYQDVVVPAPAIQAGVQRELGPGHSSLAQGGAGAGGQADGSAEARAPAAGQSRPPSS